MKQKINLGAYGWRHKHWLKTFYPADLPAEDDWRLTYYSNEFNAVLVPADYWIAEKISECENWLESVREDFQFFVECNSSLLEKISLTDFTKAIKMLLPQLSGLVFLDENSPMPDDIKKSFITLADSLQLELFDVASDSSRFILIGDELTDLRAVRVVIESFAVRLGESGSESEKEAKKEGIVIINHPQLKAQQLRKFRSVLDIMGH